MGKIIQFPGTSPPTESPPEPEPPPTFQDFLYADVVSFESEVQGLADLGEEDEERFWAHVEHLRSIINGWNRVRS